MPFQSPLFPLGRCRRPRRRRHARLQRRVHQGARVRRKLPQTMVSSSHRFGCAGSQGHDECARTCADEHLGFLRAVAVTGRAAPPAPPAPAAAAEPAAEPATAVQSAAQLQRVQQRVRDGQRRAVHRRRLPQPVPAVVRLLVRLPRLRPPRVRDGAVRERVLRRQRRHLPGRRHRQRAEHQLRHGRDLLAVRLRRRLRRLRHAPDRDLRGAHRVDRADAARRRVAQPSPASLASEIAAAAADAVGRLQQHVRRRQRHLRGRRGGVLLPAVHARDRLRRLRLPRRLHHRLRGQPPRRRPRPRLHRHRDAAQGQRDDARRDGRHMRRRRRGRRAVLLQPSDNRQQLLHRRGRKRPLRLWHRLRRTAASAW